MPAAYIKTERILPGDCPGHTRMCFGTLKFTGRSFGLFTRAAFYPENPLVLRL